MNQQQKSPGYSLHWALSIVSDFTRKYVRATDAVKTIYGFTDENVADWLANQPQRWQNYKKVVKLLTRWQATQDRLHQAAALLNKDAVELAVRVLKITY